MFINLKSFAEHSQKIPSAFLAPNAKFESHIPVYKVFAALMIDMSIVSLFLTYMATVMVMTVNFQFLPNSLFLTNLPELATMSALPLLALSYFFAANLLNNGQSIGMHLLKIRLPTHRHGFYESFMWAAHSVLGAVTFGISILATKSKWKEIESHDFLYSELLAHKDHAPINLLHEIEHFTHDVQEEDVFQTAA